jgi:amidase
VPLEPLAQAPRIAVVKTPKWPVASDVQRAHFVECIIKLQAAGARVREVTLPRLFDGAWDNVMVISAYEAVRSHAVVESRHRIRLSPALMELLDRGRAVTPEQYAKALARREEYRRWLDRLFESHEAIATIPAAGEAPESLASTGDPVFCSLWTQAAMPAVTIPTGRGLRGLPLGFQIVGRYREDEHALRVAAWCEATLGFNPGLAGG